MSTDHNRLLLQIEQAMRAINQETIKPILPELSLSDLDPVISLVARTRAHYLRELFDLGAACQAGSEPTAEQIASLRSLRESYEELVAGAQALETAIQRGYLDVLHHR